MPFVQYITIKTKPCKEGRQHGERICLVHDYAWPVESPVCNSILNATADTVDEGLLIDVTIKWEEH